MDNDTPITIADLYPEISLEEQEEAEADIKAYLSVVERIYNHLHETGELKDVLLRAQWEKRKRKR